MVMAKSPTRSACEHVTTAANAGFRNSRSTASVGIGSGGGPRPARRHPLPVRVSSAGGSPPALLDQAKLLSLGDAGAWGWVFLRWDGEGCGAQIRQLAGRGRIIGSSVREHDAAIVGGGKT